MVMMIPPRYQDSSKGPEMDAECLHEENDTYDTIYDNYDEILFLL